MKAAVYERYGEPEVVQIQEIEKPIPGDDDILIKVMATTVSAVDSIFRRGNKMFPRLATGIVNPKISILGTELSGVVESVGENVHEFSPGDPVIADSGTNYGTHAEYVVISRKDPVILKPDNLSFKEAAAVTYGALTALAFLRDNGNVQSGQKVLVLGASGSVGSYAIQLANHLGAEVTGVCSTKNVQLVRSLGADRVIDYKKESVTDQSGPWDVIFDAVGKYSFRECKPMLKDKGIYLTTVLSFAILGQMVITSLSRGKKAVLALTGLRPTEQKNSDLAFIKNLIEKGELHPVIDRSYPLDNISEAYSYVDRGHKKGNVVITVALSD